MIWNYLKPIIIFIPLAVIQMVIVPLISVYDIAPNLVLILIVYYTLIDGQIFGIILGFILGLLFDLISGGIIGASSLAFTVAAFIAGYFYNENKIESNTTTFLFIIILFLCGVVNSFLYSSVATNNPDVKFINLILYIGILPGLYSAILGLPVIIFKPKKGIV